MNPQVVVGGFGAEKPADAEVQDVCKKVKAQFLKQSGKNAAKFVALVYKSQVVAGKNYLVKVDIGDQFCHLKIFVPLPHTGEDPELLGWQCGKTKNDAITSF
ncbi:leukocyte cysteine proteinase inhibitor 1-like [Phyllobates terribilis]|uniref:leukocyte cysteine proteinase inhibitor 1-like n=1 Tax=Phyllobates terribilis TaxID=111132 RepID=UPI003CCB49A6